MTLVAFELVVITACVVGAWCFRLWLRFLESRETKRHERRAELVRLKADAWKADEVMAMAERVRRLELKGLQR